MSTGDMVSLTEVAGHFGVSENMAYKTMVAVGTHQSYQIMNCNSVGEIAVHSEVYEAILDSEITVDGKIIDITTLTPRVRIPFDNGIYVYFLYDADRIVYIGRSGSIAYRIASHVREKDFDMVACYRCKASNYELIEAINIYHHKPMYNTDIWQPVDRFKAILKECQFGDYND